MNEWITIYSDASFDQRTGAAGWGVWARTSDDFMTAFGPCPDWVKTSQDAEGVAVVRGLKLALEAWPNPRGVTIKTDCGSVVDWLTQRQRGADGSAKRRIVERFCEVAGGLDVRVQWVKGHQGAQAGPQGAVNGKADRYAALGRTGKSRVWIKSRDVAGVEVAAP